MSFRIVAGFGSCLVSWIKDQSTQLLSRLKLNQRKGGVMGENAVHLKIKMEVFGKEYWVNEMTYAVTSLELVQALQAQLAKGLLEMNAKKV